MTSLDYGIVYLLSLVALLVIDGVWLGLIARQFYKDNIGHLMARKPDLRPAIVFYLIYVAGIIIFAVQPSLGYDTAMHAALLGALLGGLAYATYDLTNAATLKDWPVRMTVIDILWGGFLTGMVASFGYMAARWLA